MDPDLIGRFQEYLYFKQILPPQGLTNHQFTTMNDRVFSYLNIDTMPSLDPKMVDAVPPNIKQHLFNLSMQDGMSYLLYVTPPVNECLECERPLITTLRGDKPTQVTVHTTEGPIPASKFILRCKECNLNYHPTYYGDKKTWKYYPLEHRSNFVLASNVVYLSDSLVKLYQEDLHHSWQSYEAFAEVYNGWHGESLAVERVSAFFCRENIDVAEEESYCLDDSDEKTASFDNIWKGRHELTRKNVSAAVCNYNIIQEMDDRQELDTALPKPIKTGMENYMRSVIDRLPTEVYDHENCSPDCEDRGCKVLAVTDGIWKISHAVCMLPNRSSFNQFKEVAILPMTCTAAPRHGSWCCEDCYKLVAVLNKKLPKKQRIPFGLRDFIKFATGNEEEGPQQYTKERYQKVQQVLSQISEKISSLKIPEDNRQTRGVAKEQGVENILNNAGLTEENIQVDLDGDDACNKDTGTKARLQSWTRGYQMTVTGGGIIRSCRPLYKSEGPLQVFLIMLSFLVVWLKKVPGIKAFTSYFLCYDNMCNVDALKISKVPLKGPEFEGDNFKFKYVWLLINKLIDDLHLRNHTREFCKQKYNSQDKLRNAVPLANTMTCEQAKIEEAKRKKWITSVNLTEGHAIHQIPVMTESSFTKTKCHKYDGTESNFTKTTCHPQPSTSGNPSTVSHHLPSNVSNEELLVANLPNVSPIKLSLAGVEERTPMNESTSCLIDSYQDLEVSDSDSPIPDRAPEYETNYSNNLVSSISALVHAPQLLSPCRTLSPWRKPSMKSIESSALDQSSPNYLVRSTPMSVTGIFDFTSPEGASSTLPDNIRKLNNDTVGTENDENALQHHSENIQVTKVVPKETSDVSSSILPVLQEDSSRDSMTGSGSAKKTRKKLGRSQVSTASAKDPQFT